MHEKEIHECKILIVDDMPDNILILEEVLKRAGFQHIDCETDPRGVLELVCKQDFDLILLDIQMPYLDGFQVMSQLRKLEEKLPVIIVLTANNEPIVRHEALAGGAKDFISKPFDHKEVIFRIRNILEMRVMQKKLNIKNGQLEERCQSRTEELVQTRLQAIRCLGKAAEYRDNETGMHVIRISKIAARIGQELGLNESQCDLILIASPMHDIGKIGIPDSILLKPGRLDDEEWKIMQSHSIIGEKILSIPGSELFEVAAEIARSHHEKWDGSGYPDGLKGEDIPLMSRIVSVCDTFDALLSVRPYKKSWPIDDVVTYIRDKSGTQFDPAIVEAFNHCFEDIVSITEKYADENGQRMDLSAFPLIDPALGE